MTTSALRRLAVGLVAPAALVVGLAACGSSDVSKEKFQSELEEQSQLTEEQAGCVVDRLYDELDQDQINEVYEADEDDTLSDEADAAATAALEECVTAG